MEKSVERYGILELTFSGPSTGNPFLEQKVTGRFTGKNETVTADGFYDGDGVYKVRFMPSFTGEYRYETDGSFDGAKTEGTFTVTPAKEGNHGPVRVVNQYHFAYEDGTPFYPVGTTCYVWNHQKVQVRKATLSTLSKGYFNKIRFCVFPKHYDYNLTDPKRFPYEGTPMDASVLTKDNFYWYSAHKEGNHFDFTRFDPLFFRQVEKSILELQALGIEADLIVMHPYDRWGFSEMTKEQDDLYWNYVIARFAAFRNLWWSLANEYDLLTKKTVADWERYADILCKKDPYRHLRSIHNCHAFYDHTRPWITHASIQRQDLYKTTEFVSDYRIRYQKPIVMDEIAYEGNINHAWGNISGPELVRRFWEAAVRGGYATHGETILNDSGLLWWSHGGDLYGESPARIWFLWEILKETPGYGLKPWSEKPFTWDDIVAVPEEDRYQGEYFLLYFGNFRPSFREYYFDEETPYRIEIIDTWDMTISDIGIQKGKIHIPLPGKEYVAIRIRKERNA